MNSLTLSKRPENALPERVTVDGADYPIHADFRTVLKIFRLMGDFELEDRHKYLKLLELFYVDAVPPFQQGVEAFFEFIRAPERKSDPEAAHIDYEFDADAIYASFFMQYRIDLLNPEIQLHWYAFTALLNGLDEDTPLCKRLYFRALDTKKFKGKAKRSAEIAKANAQIPQKLNPMEQSRQSALEDALMNGGDVSAIINRE